jgi:hypothetical protein
MHLGIFRRLVDASVADVVASITAGQESSAMRGVRRRIQGHGWRDELFATSLGTLRRGAVEGVPVAGREMDTKSTCCCAR